MSKSTKSTGQTYSYAEDLFVELFFVMFLDPKNLNIYIFNILLLIYMEIGDIFDFALENEDMKIAIEIDGGENIP